MTNPLKSRFHRTPQRLLRPHMIEPGQTEARVAPGFRQILSDRLDQVPLDAAPLEPPRGSLFDACRPATSQDRKSRRLQDGSENDFMSAQACFCVPLVPPPARLRTWRMKAYLNVGRRPGASGRATFLRFSPEFLLGLATFRGLLIGTPFGFGDRPWPTTTSTCSWNCS